MNRHVEVALFFLGLAIYGRLSDAIPDWMATVALAVVVLNFVFGDVGQTPPIHDRRPEA